MNKNTEHYVKIYKNFLQKDFCRNFIKKIEKISWQEHYFTELHSTKQIKLSGKNELACGFEKEMSKEHKFIMDELWFKIREYVDELKFPWFNGWRAYSSLRFNKYMKTKKMAEHCDHISSLFNGEGGVPILSIVILFNDNFKGGEFIMFKDTEYKLKTGDLLIFPSNFLFPHKVKPIKEGKRYSAVSWVW